jgi:hypothetical protein
VAGFWGCGPKVRARRGKAVCGRLWAAGADGLGSRRTRKRRLKQLISEASRADVRGENDRLAAPQHPVPPGPSGFGYGFEPLGEALEGADRGKMASDEEAGSLALAKCKTLDGHWRRKRPIGGLPVARTTHRREMASAPPASPVGGVLSCAPLRRLVGGLWGL